MKIAIIRDTLSTLTLRTWLKIGAGLLITLTLAYAVYLYLHANSLAADLTVERQKNVEIQQRYEDALLEAKKHEAIGAEYKLRAEALQGAIDERKQSVVTLDKKYEQAIENFEQEKKEMGDCAHTPDPAECYKQQRALLCKELREQGFNCPDAR